MPINIAAANPTPTPITPTAPGWHLTAGFSSGSVDFVYSPLTNMTRLCTFPAAAGDWSGLCKVTLGLASDGWQRAVVCGCRLGG